MERYTANEINGKGYIFDKQFSDVCPIAVEKTIEIAEKLVAKYNAED